MVVQDRETTDRHGEALRQSLQPILNPLLTMLEPLAAEKGAANTAGNTMVVTSYFNVHLLASGYGHRAILHSFDVGRQTVTGL